jgi:signal peptidase
MKMLTTRNGELAAEMVRSSGHAWMCVSGTSMAPAVRPGDLLLVEHTAATKVSRGEIVVFARGGRLIAHRVVDAIGNPRAQYLITRGDRTRRNDGLVSGKELLGRVKSIERGRNRFRPDSRPNPLQRAVGLLLRGSDRATCLYLRLAALWQQRLK